MPTRCFWLEPARQARLSLRRFSPFDPAINCPQSGSGHDASVFLFDVPETFDFEAKHNSQIYRHAGPQERADVPPEYLWPEFCVCSYRFVESDQWQISSQHLYIRTDNGVLITWEDAGPGAMMNAEWLADHPAYRGPDGRSLMVKCPNGLEWCIDSFASNCTMPTDYNHKCWVRHGTPPMITVDKNGQTCAAGAGSIQAGDYHGFLINGTFNP